MSQQSSDSNRQLVYLYAGAGACFLAGWGAHVAFSSWRSTGPRAAPQSAARLPQRLSTAGGPSDNHSAVSTPRESTAASVGDNSLYKMALLVRTDLPQLGRGRAAVLCAHGALQQYKKVYRRRDPARAEWEEEGSKKLCLAVPGDHFARYRQAAKAQGIPTFLVSDPRVTGAPENIVLVIGPAASSVVDSIVGDLKLLD